MVAAETIEIPEELKAKLAEAKSDNEACAVLSAAGMDLKAMEDELGISELESVAGGWGIGSTSHCPFCGETDGDKISYQFFVSLFIDSGSKYRCRTCGSYFYIVNGGIRKYN